MKRIVFIALIVVLSLSGCSSTSGSEENTSDHSGNSQEQLKDPTTLTEQSIDISNLKEYEPGDIRYPGMSGKYFDLALERDSKAVVIPEYSTHFVYWLPPGWENLEEKRILFLFHGHDGTAAPRLNDLYDNALAYQIGVVSIQWGWRPEKGEDYRYLDETVEGMHVAYHIVEIALDYIEAHHGVDKNLSAWNGFSRSSGHSIVYAYLDTESGNGFFQLYMGIAGGFNIRTPFIEQLVNGEYGEKPVEGKNFYLWCGTSDEATDERVIEGYPNSVCERQQLSRDILLERGGTVMKLRATPDAGHMTWNSKPKLQTEALELWLNIK